MKKGVRGDNHIHRVDVTARGPKKLLPFPFSYLFELGWRCSRSRRVSGELKLSEPCNATCTDETTATL